MNFSTWRRPFWTFVLSGAVACSAGCAGDGHDHDDHAGHEHDHAGHDHAGHDHKGHDHEGTDQRLGHCAAAICAKEAKPSDIIPVSTKAMPSPRSPAGRSA